MSDLPDQNVISTGNRKLQLLMALSTVTLALALPALWSLFSIILRGQRPDGFGLYSFLLVPALAVLLFAAWVGWSIHQETTTKRTTLWFIAHAFLFVAAVCWLVPAALLGPLWLMDFMLQGSNLG